MTARWVRFPANPWIDDFGLLRYQGRWVALSDTEWRIMAPLVASFGQPIWRAVLIDAAWGETKVGDRALDVRIAGARRRIQTLRLKITTVRCRGYLLEPS